jgi:hypothetical protein
MPDKHGKVSIEDISPKIKKELFNQGITPSAKIKNAFNKNLEGWDLVQDAFNDLSSEDPYYNNLESSRWCRDQKWEEDSFKVNTLNFRSDNFIKVHKGKHVLFSGCSATYGVGLYAKETWPYKVYSKILEEEDLSGYFNISKPGSSIMEIVVGIFKYTISYGKPDVVFINLPDMYRGYKILSEKSISGHGEEFIKNTIDGFFQVTGTPRVTIEKHEYSLYSYQYLLMLETFCNFLGIELYVFSYNQELNDLLNFCDLESMIFVNRKDVNKSVFKSDTNISRPYGLTARDGKHHGSAFHDVWSDIMFNEYKTGRGKYVR